MPLRDGSYYPDQGVSTQPNPSEEGANIDPSIEINVSQIILFLRLFYLPIYYFFFRNYSLKRTLKACNRCELETH